MENGLTVSSLQGHLTSQDVVDGLQGICTVIASAAGHEIGDTHDHLAAFDVVSTAAVNVEQTGGNALVVAGSGIGVDGAALYALGSLNSVLSHNKELPFKKCYSVAKRTSYNISLAHCTGKCKHFYSPLLEKYLPEYFSHPKELFQPEKGLDLRRFFEYDTVVIL
jgi:hypothetical protein